MNDVISALVDDGYSVSFGRLKPFERAIAVCFISRWNAGEHPVDICETGETPQDALERAFAKFQAETARADA